MDLMARRLNSSEEAQLQQTIEMFEVIAQSQPNDCQSLEILKEAYTKLGREQEVINTSKRIAQAYMQMGQLSSAILEYETVLQRRPDDADVQAALRQIEDKANNVAVQDAGVESAASVPSPTRRSSTKRRGRWRRKLTTATRPCAKFLSKPKSSARAILICAGGPWI
jgi:tetratricopeptide (TPR) repeat protein